MRALTALQRAKLEFCCWIDSPHAMYDYLIGCGILVYSLRHVSENKYSLAHCDSIIPFVGLCMKNCQIELWLLIRTIS